MSSSNDGTTAKASCLIALRNGIRGAVLLTSLGIIGTGVFELIWKAPDDVILKHEELTNTVSLYEWGKAVIFVYESFRSHNEEIGSLMIVFPLLFAFLPAVTGDARNVYEKAIRCAAFIIFIFFCAGLSFFLVMRYMDGCHTIEERFRFYSDEVEVKASTRTVALLTFELIFLFAGIIATILLWVSDEKLWALHKKRGPTSNV